MYVPTAGTEDKDNTTVTGAPFTTEPEDGVATSLPDVSDKIAAVQLVVEPTEALVKVMSCHVL
jgi:vacuolar-type H+-ATPase subunit B/Vma2